MTPKVKIFKNVFPNSSTGHQITFDDQICWNSGSVGLVPAPILHKMGQLRTKFPERCYPLTCLVSTYTEFGSDRLHFAGLIPERLIFWPKKSVRYRLSAYKYIKQ